MSNLVLALIGLGVFSLMSIGLVLTMTEFTRISDRPDKTKGIDSSGDPARNKAA